MTRFYAGSIRAAMLQATGSGPGARLAVVAGLTAPGPA